MNKGVDFGELTALTPYVKPVSDATLRVESALDYVEEPIITTFVESKNSVRN